MKMILHSTPIQIIFFPLQHPLPLSPDNLKALGAAVSVTVFPCDSAKDLNMQEESTLLFHQCSTEREQKKKKQMEKEKKNQERVQAANR